MVTKQKKVILSKKRKTNQKELKPQHFFLNCGTYPFDILVFINLDTAKTKKYLGKWFDEKDIAATNFSENCNGRTQLINNKNIFIQLHKFHRNCFTCDSVAAHEIFHAVEFLFEKVGVKHSEETSEAWAYQIEYLIKQLYKKIK